MRHSKRSKDGLSKQCPHCKKMKPLTEYHNKISTEDKHGYACKLCTNKYNRKHRANLPPKKQEQYKQKQKASRIAFKIANPEEYNEKNKENFKTWISKPGNRELHNKRRSEYQKKYYQKNKEKLREYDKTRRSK